MCLIPPSRLVGGLSLSLCLSACWCLAGVVFDRKNVNSLFSPVHCSVCFTLLRALFPSSFIITTRQQVSLRLAYQPTRSACSSSLLILSMHAFLFVVVFLCLVRSSELVFSQYGSIKRTKVYRDDAGHVKGDGLVIYAKPASVDLAVAKVVRVYRCLYDTR